MQLKTKFLGGNETGNIELPAGSTVAALKEEISRKLLLPSDSFKIICVGKPIIDDEKLLSEVGLRDDAKLTIMLKDKIKPSNKVELAVFNSSGGGKKGVLAMLRFNQAVDNFVFGLSLDDLERYASSLAESSA